MQVNEIMTKNLELIESTENLNAAAERMKSLGVGILPVKKADQVVGVITDRDIVVRGLAEGKDPAGTLVSDVMSSQLVYCNEDDSVEEVGKIMEQKQVRRVLVLDENERITGIISLGDLVTKSHQEQFCGEVLEHISEPG